MVRSWLLRESLARNAKSGPVGRGGHSFHRRICSRAHLFGFASKRVDDFAVSKTNPQSAIRRGNFKLIRFMEDAASELYDLSVDQSESSDLTPQVSKIVDDLADSLDAYLGRVQARIPEPAGRHENP